MIESTHARVLADYARLREHSWSTPGHQGGIAFTKHPAGRAFFEGLKAPHADIDKAALVEAAGRQYPIYLDTGFSKDPAQAGRGPIRAPPWAWRR